MNSRLSNILKGLSNPGTSSVHNTASDNNSGETSKVYSLEEAGDYIETTYNCITVYVRENYPYYNPQNDKIYYSKEEEAEELYQLSKDMTKSSLKSLDI